MNFWIALFLLVFATLTWGYEGENFSNQSLDSNSSIQIVTGCDY